MSLKTFGHFYSLIFFAAITCLIASCTELNAPKEWDNYRDPNGTNYNPPKVELHCKDTAIAINQQLTLTASSNDTNIIVYFWQIDTNEIDTLSSTDTFKLKWTETSDTGTYKIYVKAISSDGLESSRDSTIVRVALCFPVIQKIPDTSASSSANVVINFAATDSAGTIVKYLIDIGNSGWICTTQTASYTFSGNNNGPIDIIWAAVNNFGFFTADTFTIFFNRKPDTASLISPTSDKPAKFALFDYSNIWGKLTLVITGSDPDKDADKLTYSFYLGEYGSPLKLIHSGKDTSFSKDTLLPDTKYSWRLCAKDLFNDSIVVSGEFTTESGPENPQGMKLIRSAGKKFRMGQDGDTTNHSAVHDVGFTNNFWMDSTEITNDFFEFITGTKLDNSQGNSYPVSGVSWFDAILFCNIRSKKDNLDTVYSYTITNGIPGNVNADMTKQGYRLPTEAEWEFACRANSNGLFYWGNERIELEQYAWVSLTSDSTVHEVGKRLPNKYGLYDMSGNLWEWCNDWYASISSEISQIDPVGPETGVERVLRGGSWKHSDYFAQSGTRTRLDPNTKLNTVGFRTVLIFAKK